MARAYSPYEFALQQGLWTPANELSDLALWWDASAPSTLTYGATGFSRLRSRIGIPYLEQDNSGIQPGLSRINGRDCLNFTGANYLMTMFTAGNTTSLTNAFVLGCVFSIRNAGSNARPITFIKEAGGSDYDNNASIALLQRTSAGTWDTYQNNGSRVTSTGNTDDTPHVFVLYSDGTNCHHYVNGVLKASGTWGTISLGAGRFHTGCYTSNGVSTDYRGLWGEAVALRNGSLQKAHWLGGYLGHRWKIPLLGGPYAGFAPNAGG